MNQDILKGQWRQIRGNVRSTFGKLTDDDLEVINGDAEVLMGKIQERYGYTREQASDAWSRFTSDMGFDSSNAGAASTGTDSMNTGAFDDRRRTDR